MIRAGVCCIDITPPAGLAMSGFGARVEAALGAHDPLTVRAVTINNTALVVVDVLGLHEEMSERIRQRCSLPSRSVVLTALHTHGGPASMRGRGGAVADPAYLEFIESACVTAIDRAAAGAVPARISAGYGADPDVARNRRHPDGPLDRSLPVVRIETADGRPLAVIVSYACHPVVLGADNRLWTADYPHFVRKQLEEALPGALAVFATGCCGDANTGHSAQASMSIAANPSRTFAAAERIGGRIAAAALVAKLEAMAPSADVTAVDCKVNLALARRETLPPAELARIWRNERASADPMRALMLGLWIRWAESAADEELASWSARISVFNWCGIAVVALPGEIFAETALAIRAELDPRPALVLAFGEGNPGYIPPASEFPFGGYEVDEAHRYYGLPAGFAPGSAEALCAAVCRHLRN